MHPSSRPTNVRWLVVLLLMGFALLAHFNRVAISVAGSGRFIGEGRLTAEQMGVVYSAFLLVYTLCMIPGGWLIDRVGPRRAMAGMGLGFGTCAALTGVLGWSGLEVAALWLPLLAVRGLAGALSSPLHPGAAWAVSLWLPPTERSTANGLVGTGALVGIALSYPVFGWLMDRLDWPLAFVLSGAALALLGLVWAAASADSPAGHPRANEAERQLAAGVPPRNTATLRDLLGLLRNRGLVLLTLSYGAVGYVQYMFFYWVEFYFLNQMKLPAAESREAAFVISLSMAVGMGCGGWCSDVVCRRLGPGLGCRAVALAGMGLCAVFALLGVSATDPRQVVWYFSLSLGTLGVCEGIFWTTAAGLEPRRGGLACALLNTGGNGVGMLAPVVTPVLGQQYGWDAAVGLACAVCVGGGLLWLGIRAGPESPTNSAPESAPAGVPPESAGHQPSSNW